MTLRLLATSSALLGGACWVAHMFVDLDLLLWAGLVLLGVATAAVGAGLAGRSVVWLRLVTGLGCAALAGSLLELAREAVDERLLLGGVGGAATLVVAVSLLVRRPAASAHRNPRGNH